MNFQKEYWNNEHCKQISKKPEYDFWLDSYREILEEAKGAGIIDLGCGRGNNSLYLTERGFRVTACDISDIALDRVRQYIPEAETRILDMLDGLPFGSGSSAVIIADLCLHYFLWAETVNILKEIHRVLKSGGWLLFRVNSTKDVNYGAGQGILIEDDYYDIGGNRKRFFDREQLEALFSEWKLIRLSEYQMDRYRMPKILWEGAAGKK